MPDFQGRGVTGALLEVSGVICVFEAGAYEEASEERERGLQANEVVVCVQREQVPPTGPHLSRAQYVATSAGKLCSEGQQEP